MNNKRNEFLLFFILITTIVFILFNQEIKSTISENKILYIYSSLPQTVGAVYGLTITGYIFFIGNQNSKIADDPTTEDIIKETNKEQFDSLKDLSALVFISILFCIFTIYSYNVSTPHFSEVNKVVVSLANSFSIGALIANFLFIVNVIDPKSIEKTSARIIKSINNNKTNDILKGEGKTENIIPLNTWVIIALACAFIGLGIFLMDRKNKASIRQI